MAFRPKRAAPRFTACEFIALPERGMRPVARHWRRNVDNGRLRHAVIRFGRVVAPVAAYVVYRRQPADRLRVATGR